MYIGDAFITYGELDGIQLHLVDHFETQGAETIGQCPAAQMTGSQADDDLLQDQM